MRLHLIPIHDDLYAQGNEILKRYNPCKWENGQCAAGTHGCCQGCEHLGPHGCTVKSLSCKVWLCSHVIHNTTEGWKANKQLRVLKHVAFDCGIQVNLVRATQEQECK